MYIYICIYEHEIQFFLCKDGRGDYMKRKDNWNVR